jgi:hypothetical protein
VNSLRRGTGRINQSPGVLFGKNQIIDDYERSSRKRHGLSQQPTPGVRNPAKIGIPGYSPRPHDIGPHRPQRRRRQGWAEDAARRTPNLRQPKGGHDGDDRGSNHRSRFPLKALVWQDADGKVWLSYNNPEYLKQRHNIPDDLLKNISGIRAIAEEAVRQGP